MTSNTIEHSALREVELLVSQSRMREAAGKIEQLQLTAELDSAASIALSQLALSTGMVRMAVVLAEQAVAAVGQSEAASLHLATVCIYGRQYARALQVCEQLLAINAELAGAMLLMGHCYAGRGEFPLAEHWFDAALQREPANVAAISGLAKCRRFSDDCEAIVNQFRQAFKHKLEVSEQASVHYAIGKIYNDAGQYEKAWSHANNANALIRLRYPFNQRQVLKTHIDRLISAFHTVGPAPYDNDIGAQPVMIVGMPRSGTTLMEQILACHPDFYPGGEVPAIEYAFAFGAPTRNAYSAAAMPAAERAAAADAYRRYFSEFSDVSAPRITTKVLKSYLDVGFFKQMFPAGKVIHMERDELDVAASVFFENFSSTSFSSSLDDTWFVHQQSRRMMAHWKRIFPDDVLTVRYEDLVNEFESNLQNVSAFLGISREDIGDHTQATNQVETPSLWQVRQGIYQSSIGRWRRYPVMLEFAKSLGRT